MDNLLEETKEILEGCGKSPEDVLWCGSEEFGYFSWKDFEKFADTLYDSGYGGENVATDMLVVGKDFWLERREYDGSEWWQYKQTPIKPKNNRIPACLTVSQSGELELEGTGGTDLKNLHGEE